MAGLGNSNDIFEKFSTTAVSRRINNSAKSIASTSFDTFSETRDHEK